MIRWNPAKVTLYQFVSKYTKTWQPTGQDRVPHITPNFNYIPRKGGNTQSRYALFLRSILLSHQAGSQLEKIISKELCELENLVQQFLASEDCPQICKEEFAESQLNQATNSGNEEEEEVEVMVARGDEEELHVEPEHQPEQYEQSEWMEALKPIHHEEQQFYEGDADYDDLETIALAKTFDWQEDRIRLGLTSENLREIPQWIVKQKETFKLDRESLVDDHGPSYDQLNAKQKFAFNIVKSCIEVAQSGGLSSLPQLLMNISGGAGTGKTFWLNAVRRFSSEAVGLEFVKAAAPSGTAAFLIGGETLHSLFYLPVGPAKLEPLQGEKLVELQRRFQKVGILIIDEKSMIGQEIFWMVNERLKEARPHFKTEPFGKLSVVLLGDWRQLPPVCDSSLFNCEAKNPRGFNLYQLFEEVVCFEVVQRQQGDDQALFRKELQSLGDGQFTRESWNRWRSRTLDLLSPEEREDFRQNGILACALKKDMVQHNIMKVKSNNEPVAPIFAVSSPKEACKESSERASGLNSKIIISRKTVFRLTSNLWTSVGLTNGAVGTVHAIIYTEGEKPPGLPLAIIAIFKDYTGPSYLKDVPNSVPIVPVRREWFSNKIHCTRTMLPLILGYALSIHKLQGSTCERVILNPGKKEFAMGLLLVGATRTKTFEGLAFDPYPNFTRFEQVNNSKSLIQRLKEETRMANLEVLTIGKYSTLQRRDETVNLQGVQGLRWGTGKVTNSCTVDNFLTLLWIRTIVILQFMEQSPVELLLKNIMQMMKCGFQGEAKKLWAESLHQKGLPVRCNTANAEYDLLGNEKQMLFDHLSEISQITCTAVCSNCHFVKSFQTTQHLPNLAIKIPTYLKTFEQCINLGACPSCHCFDLHSPVAKFNRATPWMFPVEVEGVLSANEISDIPKEISVCQNKFNLAFISLQFEGHFTGLFWDQNNWYYYDGMMNDAKLQCIKNPSQKLGAHLPVHIVFLR